MPADRSARDGHLDAGGVPRGKIAPATVVIVAAQG